MIKLENFFSALNKKRVRYLLAGGMAVNLYGIERATADIDIIVDLKENNLNRFIDVVKELGLKPKMPVKLEDLLKKEQRELWVKEKGMMVFSIYDPKNPFFLLDVFIEVPFDFKKVYHVREKMKAGNIVIPVVPLEHLIEMKDKTGRLQDKADVYYLKKIKNRWKDED